MDERKKERKKERKEEEKGRVDSDLFPALSVLNNLFRLVALTFSGLVLFLKTYSFYCRWVPFLEYFFPGGYLVYSPAVLGSYFRVSR